MCKKIDRGIDVDNKKLEEVLNDENFIKSIIHLNDNDEIDQAFKQKGIDLSKAEIDQFKDTLTRATEGKLADEELKFIDAYSNVDTDELNDDQLENVTGGLGIWGIACLITLVAIAVGSLCTQSKKVTHS